jgi:hypothetical protein
LCGGLWHDWNEWTWNQKERNPNQITQWAADATEGSAAQRRWVKPNTGELKCNVDAAFHRSIDKTSYGCCLRDKW